MRERKQPLKSSKLQKNFIFLVKRQANSLQI